MTTITIAQWIITIIKINWIYIVTEVVGNYWEQNLEMIQTFWFMRLDEGEMWKNVVWKWQKCHGKVEEGDGDRNLVCKYCGKKIAKVSHLSVNEFKLATYKTLVYDRYGYLSICMCMISVSLYICVCVVRLIYSVASYLQSRDIAHNFLMTRGSLFNVSQQADVDSDSSTVRAFLWPRKSVFGQLYVITTDFCLSHSCTSATVKRTLGSIDGIVEFIHIRSFIRINPLTPTVAIWVQL